MSTRIAYSGRVLTIEFAELADGSMPALEFINKLDQQTKARVYALFHKLGDSGRINNELQFKKVQGAYWEFKALQARLICYFTENRCVILTNGFLKKKQKMPKNELDRAITVKGRCINPTSSPIRK